MTSTTSRPDPAAVVRRLQAVLGPAGRGIPLHEPRLDGAARAYVNDTLDSTFVSSVGAYVDRFEALLAETCGVRRAVAVVNGTAALQVALKLVGVGPGEEVLVPALTFVATANAAAHLGAVPHFCDSEDTTLGLDAARLDAYLGRIAVRRGDALVNRDTGRRIAAVVPMHVFGLPVDMAALARVTARWGLPIVEDAAEALGATHGDRKAGRLAGLAALSFNGNKIITTGGGGAILTDDDALADRAKHLTTTAKVPHRWRFDHDEIAYNFRLPNINAALGVAQLERLPAFVAAKRRLAARYRSAFADLDGAHIVPDPPGCESNAWLVALRLEQPDEGALDAILAATNEAGYMTRPAWTPLHRLPMYAAAPRMALPCAEALAASLINLPSSPSLELDRDA